jgi:type II secretory pathway component PulJ
MKKKAFTLMEVIVAITIFFVLLVVIVGLYTKMIRLKYNIQARQSLIQNSYDAMEKINLLLKDYTIDYEEYFNRWNVGCSGNA